MPLPDTPAQEATDRLHELDASNLSEGEVELLRAAAQDSLFFLGRSILALDHMTTKLHGPMCEFLEQNAYRKYMEAARGFLKSSLGAYAYPIWLTIQDPTGRPGDLWRRFYGAEERILIISMVDTLSRNQVKQIRSAWAGDGLLPRLFPERIPNFREVRWSDEHAQLDRMGNYKEGTYMSAGLGSGIIGGHWTRVIADDLLYARKDDIRGIEVLPSPEDVRKGTAFLEQFVEDLLQNPDDEVLCIGTRWAPRDVRFWVDKKNEELEEGGEKQWKVYSQPGTHDGTPTGRPMFPEKMDEEVLRRKRISMGAQMFFSQILLQPLDPASMPFKEGYIQRYNIAQLGWRQWKKHVFVDWGGPNEGDDRTAIVVAGVDNYNNIYLIDYENGNWPDDEVVRRVLDLALKWQTRPVHVENVAHQGRIRFFEVELSRRNLSHKIMIDPITPGKGERKESRIMGMEGFYYAKMVSHQAGMTEFEDQLLNYRGKDSIPYDDLIDAFSYIQVVEDFIPVDVPRKTKAYNGPTVEDKIKLLYESAGMDEGEVDTLCALETAVPLSEDWSVFDGI